jgi:60 kDa SS-A/Ro ribonucleoprotein
MSKFNTTLPKQKTLTENLAGGEAYSQSNELALVSLLLTSFVSDQFYRNAQTTLDELRKLSSKVKDKEFVAKAAIYARDKFGMRSITHALAGELTSQLNGAEWGKDFYNKVVVRVDDMTEILSYYLAYKTSKDNPKFPNSLKKGFAKAFDKFDGYQLAKHKGENKEVKLVDVVNIVHPVPTPRNSEALSLLINGELKSTETWESKLSKVGQIAESEEDLSKLKSEAWSELISNKKLGLMAMIKNIRNIISQSPESIPLVCESLTNEDFILKSRVLPFRFATAYEEVNKIGSSKEVRDVLVAINEALEVSVQNVPKFDGETLLVMDVSGSMSGKPSEIASLFGAIVAKANSCDVMTFATNADYKSYNPMDSVMTIRNSFRYSGGGTNFKAIFQKANKKYDRIIILSDMQGWEGYTTPASEFKSYKSRFGANPFVYSWDLAGYSTLQFPEQNVFALAGFSDKVFDIMKMMEMDKQALYNEIKAIKLV